MNLNPAILNRSPPVLFKIWRVDGDAFSSSLRAEYWKRRLLHVSYLQSKVNGETSIFKVNFFKITVVDMPVDLTAKQLLHVAVREAGE